MVKKDKILQKAKASPANLDFDDLCWLAEKYGFEFSRQRGSHKLYKHHITHPTLGKRMNFQEKNGKAKDYQVEQLLEFIAYVDERNKNK